MFHRYASNVLGPISYTEAQIVAKNIVKSAELGGDDQMTPGETKEYLRAWFLHVMDFNQRFKQPESHDTFKHS